MKTRDKRALLGALKFRFGEELQMLLECSCSRLAVGRASGRECWRALSGQTARVAAVDAFNGSEWSG
jgi:hypothetical protein